MSRRVKTKINTFAIWCAKISSDHSDSAEIYCILLYGYFEHYRCGFNPHSMKIYLNSSLLRPGGLLNIQGSKIAVVVSLIHYYYSLELVAKSQFRGLITLRKIFVSLILMFAIQAKSVEQSIQTISPTLQCIKKFITFRYCVSLQPLFWQFREFCN